MPSRQGCTAKEKSDHLGGPQALNFERCGCRVPSWPTSQVVANESLVVTYNKDTEGVCKLAAGEIRRILTLWAENKWEKECHPQAQRNAANYTPTENDPQFLFARLHRAM